MSKAEVHLSRTRAELLANVERLSADGRATGWVLLEKSEGPAARDLERAGLVELHEHDPHAGLFGLLYARPAGWKPAPLVDTIPAVTKPTGRPRGRPPSPDGPRKHVAVYVPPEWWERMEREAKKGGHLNHSGEPSVSAWVADLVRRELEEGGRAV